LLPRSVLIACGRSIALFNRGMRVVICCRREEFVQLKRLSNQDVPVSAIVTLLDLTPHQIRMALLDATKSLDNDGNPDSTAASNLLDLLKFSFPCLL
jgi:hypothetical protein